MNLKCAVIAGSRSLPGNRIAENTLILDLMFCPLIGILFSKHHVSKRKENSSTFSHYISFPETAAQILLLLEKFP